MFSRRGFLKFLFSGAAIFTGATAYAFGYGPMQRPRVTRYALTPPQWPRDLPLRIAVLSDFHACEPWMSVNRIAGIVEQTNRLSADIIVLLGDFTAGMSRWKSGDIRAGDWAAALGKLSAPLGVHAVLGNHDWWDDLEAQRRGHGPIIAQLALENVGIAVYENANARLEHRGRGFWLAGLADQLALRAPRGGWRGLHDLKRTLSGIDNAEPVLLLAHEPDIFPTVLPRVALTLSGHTHGGQVNLLGWRPVVPSRFGQRYAYGHIEEEGRHLIVSGGLGCSIAPIRFGVAPEIVIVELGDRS